MEPVIPMEPKFSRTIPYGEDWITQIKWDGVRLLVYADQGKVRLFNRKRRARTKHYPELVDVPSYCSVDSVILDGEVIALGTDGKPDFHQVMRRDGIERFDRLMFAQASVPIIYMVFDVLYHQGQWVTNQSLYDRMNLLTTCLRPTPTVQPVACHTDGNAVFDAIQKHGMEGIVVKRIESAYSVGQKRSDWLKIKNYLDVVAVIGGYLLNGGVVSAVLLGMYDDRQRSFLYIGRSGTGRVNHFDWIKLTHQLRALTISESPFIQPPDRSTDVYWVHPSITVRVQYLEWPEGGVMRQPTIQTIVNARPKDCIIDSNCLRH